MSVPSVSISSSRMRPIAVALRMTTRCSCKRMSPSPGWKLSTSANTRSSGFMPSCLWPRRRSSRAAAGVSGVHDGRCEQHILCIAVPSRAKRRQGRTGESVLGWMLYHETQACISAQARAGSIGAFIMLTTPVPAHVIARGPFDRRPAVEGDAEGRAARRGNVRRANHDGVSPATAPPRGCRPNWPLPATRALLPLPARTAPGTSRGARPSRTSK